MAFALADCFEKVDASESHWKMLLEWTRISPDDAPTNDPREFLPFCAILSLGSLYNNSDKKRKEQIINIIKASASDGRWRIREAVAMGFQRVSEKNFTVIKEMFSKWIKKSSLLEKRAILVTLAHPPVLDNKENAIFSFRIADEILQGLQKLDGIERKSEEFAILKKGLEFTISVYVASLPQEGFRFLKKWAQKANLDIKKILKSNLSKTRLIKKYGPMVKEVLALI
ncbi:MAG: hypothetical protein GTO16_04485 [Candidatus Aminicenantes bacterium]|nr:hypothetical protein [Candidatus Aminicenantes bacterium]